VEKKRRMEDGGEVERDDGKRVEKWKRMRGEGGEV
jgi:hypothetical protein